jgi:hypothetical protein
MRLLSLSVALVVGASTILLIGCGQGSDGASDASPEIDVEAASETSVGADAASDVVDGAVDSTEHAADASTTLEDAADDATLDASSEAMVSADAQVASDTALDAAADASAEAAAEAQAVADASPDSTGHADAAVTADASAEDATAADVKPNLDASAEAATDASVDFVSDAGGDAPQSADSAMEHDAAPDGFEAGSADGGSTLHDEVGFIDVPPQNTAATYPARMFYVFQVADSAPAEKPLAVFFNGGPGFATTLNLLSYGTGRYTLDQANPAAAPTRNAASWTSFANLLYIDERQVGFSYGLGSDGGPSWRSSDGTYGVNSDGGPCTFAPVEDAADFVRTIIGFLDAHPALQKAPVMLVGESYGGTRATYILDLLLRYATEASRADSALQGEIQAHYDAVFPSKAGTVIGIDLAETQFGRAILIQPLVAGDLQYNVQTTLIASDPYVGPYTTYPSDTLVDPYDIQKDAGWSNGLDQAAASALSTLSGAPLLLTEEPQAIPRFGPSARATAFRIVPQSPEVGIPAADTALSASVGALQPQDDYLMEPSSACATPFNVVFSQIGSGNEFLYNLRDGVSTFITDSRYDTVIYSPAIPAFIKQYTNDSVTTDAVPDSGTERPGGFTVTFALGDGGSQSADVRFPGYLSSGHMVAVTQPQDFHDDVVAWIAATSK